MKKVALVAVIVVVMAMMIGVQSAIAAKPAATVGRIANGNVTQILSSLAPGATPTTPVTASGPWKLVVHLKTGEINFSATCKTYAGVVKYSSIGPATISVAPDPISITAAAFTVKRGDTVQTFTGGVITVDNIAGTLFVDVNGSGWQNIWGTVKLFKAAP